MLKLFAPYRPGFAGTPGDLRDQAVLARLHGGDAPAAGTAQLSRWRRWAAVGVWLCLIGAGGALAYLVGERAGIRSLQQGTLHRLDIYSTSLRSELSRYEYLPQVLSLSPDVLDLLRSPADSSLQFNANVYLETVNAHAQASALYVMDAAGLTLAASNWNQAGSFVAMNFSYRPYFQDALRGVPGRFYGIGTVSREPGYYFSYGIQDGARQLGVATVKVNLDKLDATWSHSADKVLAVDGNGVVFLSSDPGWKFRALRPLSSETLQQLAQTRQYTEAGALTPIDMREHKPLSGGDGTVVQLSAGEALRQAAGEPFGPDYLLDSRPVDGTDWKLIMLSDMKPVHALARTSAVATVFALVFLTLLVLYLQQRRRIVHQRLAAREALQGAYDELEHKVQLRTEALSEANHHLQTEIAERKRAEEILKNTLDDLVQTGKMAVLGQMSAGITHELNQPLTALRTLSANAVVFLERGAFEQVDLNLRTICQLTDRMGQITAQLKKFARRSAVSLRSVALADVIADAALPARPAHPPGAHPARAGDRAASLCAVREQPAGAGARQPARQCLRRHRRRRRGRAPGAHRGAPHARGHADRGARQRRRHRARGDAAPLRALLHHQGAGPRARPRPRDLGRHRARLRRPAARGRERARRRRLHRHLAQRTARSNPPWLKPKSSKCCSSRTTPRCAWAARRRCSSRACACRASARPSR
ncbi:two-component system C4-dicarboxylate transport sensor histidine kinase DctB [Variovorax sp. TBS-050B]|nr:two-component system C4-dicarboxylate transport sensor histidine kinase DctB [Variovorax sp. TBS-050B]